VFNMRTHYQICVSGAAKGDSVEQGKKLAEEAAVAIAKAGHGLMTGATTGLPEFAARAYVKAGGKVSLGISPAGTKVEHVLKYHLPIDAYDVILYTGLHYVGRDALLINSSDAVVSVGGRWGTMQLPDTSSKIVYRMEPLADPAQTKKNITISSEALDKFAGEHKECAVSNEFNIITRTKEGDSLNGQSPTDTKIRLDKKVTDGQAKKVGAYYYYETKTSVAPCYGTDIANIQKLTNDVYDLWDKLPTYGNVVVNP
jgi:uncharacterized protein (TIGR00725 family)